MIKQLLLIAVLCCAVVANAQQNLDFEAWTSGTPDSWDAPIAGFVAGSVNQDTIDPGEGLSSVQLTTGDCPFCVFAGYPSTEPGLILQSIASTERPLSVDFLLRADVVANDEAIFAIQLTLWDAALQSSSVIGQAGGTIPGGTSIAVWQPQNAPFQYTNANNPDSMTIVAASSDSIIFGGATGSVPTQGSTISIDAIVINYPAGIKQAVLFGADVIAYPNPASSEINFTSRIESATEIKVYDVTGRSVATTKLEYGKASLNLNSFESGMYIYNVLDNNKTIIKTSKFNVAK